MNAHATQAAPAPGELTIQVMQGDWGAADTSDIAAVLESVTTVLRQHFPTRAARIQVEFSKDAPRVLLDRSAQAAHIVLLSAQGTRWAQFAYQFAHELCHILANYEHRIIGAKMSLPAHQWFEESLCEMASLLTLNELTLRWDQAPPFERWKAYAPEFRTYADNLLAARHRQWPAELSAAAWLGRHQSELEHNPYLREENELVAGRLLLLASATPGAIETLGYLNLGDAISGGSFADYLAAWRNSSPEEHRAFIDRVIALFAMSETGAAGAPNPPPTPEIRQARQEFQTEPEKLRIEPVN